MADNDPTPVTSTPVTLGDLSIQVKDLNILVSNLESTVTDLMAKVALLEVDVDKMGTTVTSNKKKVNSLTSKEVGLPKSFLSLQKVVESQDLRINDNAMGIENTTALYNELSELVQTNKANIDKSGGVASALDDDINEFATDLKAAVDHLLPNRMMVMGEYDGGQMSF